MAYKQPSSGSTFKMMASSPVYKATDPKNKKKETKTEIPEENKTNVIIETRKLSDRFRNLDKSKMSASELKTYNRMLKNRNLTINTP